MNYYFKKFNDIYSFIKERVHIPIPWVCETLYDNKIHYYTNADKDVMLDVQFQDDGTAVDKSKSSIVIDKVGNPQVHFDETLQMNVATFNNTYASMATDYYKAYYNNKPDFKFALQNGHTMECLFKLNFAGKKPVSECKPFSSHDIGGTGFLITQQGSIAFIVNTVIDSDKNYRWAESNINPQDGKYYHVVATWDKENGIANIFINGKRVPLGSRIACAGKPSTGLDISRVSMDEGANVYLWDFVGRGGLNQKFNIILNEDGYCTIEAKHSRKVLDVANGIAEEGTNIQQWNFNGTDSQLWKLEPQSDGSYVISSKLNNNLVLDCAGGKYDDGTNVQLWTRNNSIAQKWNITPMYLDFSAGGFYNEITNESLQWFGIGCDPDINGSNHAFPGDIAICRIYDKPLTNEEAISLFEPYKDKIID